MNYVTLEQIKNVGEKQFIVQVMLNAYLVTEHAGSKRRSLDLRGA